jgi:hypothetical protein
MYKVKLTGGVTAAFNQWEPIEYPVNTMVPSTLRSLTFDKGCKALHADM